jgi:hypothetical protein
MTGQADVERLIAEWLADEAPGRAPDRILTASAARIDAKPRWIGSRIGRQLPPPFGRRSAGVVWAAALAVVVVGLGVGVILPGSRSGPAGLGSSSPSPSPLASSSGASQAPTSPVPSSTPTAAALLDSLCDLLNVEEAKSASGTRWELAALPGRKLDGDPTCHYVATGSAAPVRSQEDPLVVVAIEELVAPYMLSYWNSLGGTDVPVNGAAARWVRGQDTLVVTKGAMIVTIMFSTEQPQIPGSGSPPPAGGYEGGAMRIVQKVADRLP